MSNKITSIDVSSERWPLKTVFRISRGSRTSVRVLRVCISRGSLSGHGECTPYRRYDESVPSVSAQINSIRDIPRLSRKRLASVLPAGAARNALDCALWDLEIKEHGSRSALCSELSKRSPCISAYTVSLDTPESMKQKAFEGAKKFSVLKVKVGNRAILPRLMAVRSGAPKARLIVDANESWRPSTITRHIHSCVCAGVSMIEQPVPAGQDMWLAEIDHQIPVFADESVHTRKDLAQIKPFYDGVNIKLDKTGGLTEALALKAEARASGLRIMIGCMLGTSLAIAPAMTLVGGAEWIDLDAPLHLSQDRDAGVRIANGKLHPPDPSVWG